MNLVGKSIGSYRITEQLGQGGMAIVYRAYDTQLDREVALKVIRSEDIPKSKQAIFIKRFEREARAQAMFDHPNIVPVFEYGEHKGMAYLVMAFQPGGTLKKVTGQRFSFEEAATLLRPIADALAYAHSRGVIHRDLKPSNILIGKGGVPLLTDFGIAKTFEMEDVSLTATGMGLGTPEYMAPEQWKGKSVLHSDIYGLGVVLYELVTGRKPYSADTPAAVAIMQATEPLPLPSSLGLGISAGAERVILKALANNPEDRYSSAADFSSALQKFSPKDPGKLGILQAVFEKSQVDLTVDEFPSQVPKADSTDKEKTTKSIFRRWVPAIAVLAVIILFATYWTFERNSKKSAMAEPSATSLVADTTSETVTPPSEIIGPSEASTASPIPTIETSLTSTTSIMSLPSIEVKGPNTAINNGDKADLVLVPAGEFQMGLSDEQVQLLYSYCGNCPSGKFEYSQPIHTVYLDDYWIYKYEVTVEEYSDCVKQGLCEPPHSTSSATIRDYYYNERDQQAPVINVDWEMADTYCKWAGGRLPTEAEWEKASRGTDGRLFPWGNQSPNTSMANFGLAYGDVTEVGRFASGVSPYGVYDMAGNVYEWANDWYHPTYYSVSPYENPQGPDNSGGSNILKVVRGGSFYWGSAYLAVGFHDWWEVFQYGDGVGFRCAVS